MDYSNHLFLFVVFGKMVGCLPYEHIPSVNNIVLGLYLGAMLVFKKGTIVVCGVVVTRNEWSRMDSRIKKVFATHSSTCAQRRWEKPRFSKR